MRSRKWLVFGLVASLAINLALAGFVVGRLGAPGLAPVALDPSLGLIRVVRGLPDDRREALSGELREHFRSLRPNIRQMRVAQRQINESLAEEPFQPQALTEALATFRGALLDSQQHSHEVLVAIAARMTPDERRQLGEAMTRRRGPPGHAHGVRPEGGPEARGGQ